MKKNIIILILIGTAFPKVLSAQGIPVSIMDQNTGEPVGDVMVLLSFPASTKSKTFISDKNGFISILDQPPFEIHLTHLNYHDHTHHIKDPMVLNIKLIPKIIALDETVVTGQYQPQPSSNSVYSVKTINGATIKNMGAIQLTDVLSKQLNIRISPDVAIGSSSMTMQGIPGNNVKILVDGVPLINRNGNGNDADLGQINVANIERIEVVEGPMAINYGANALAGVVNIITKKAEKDALRIGLTFQGESIDNDYGVEDGVSNFNISSGFSLPKSFLLSVNGGTTRFGGFQGNKTGREFLWNPKDQYFYDANLSYATDNLTITYKFDDFNEKIVDPDSLRQEVHQATGAVRPFGVDAEFKSKRITHQLQSKGKLSKFNRFDLVLSYSDFNRKKRTYKNYLDTSEEIDFTANGSSDTTRYSAFVVRGNFQNINSDKFINYQIGFESNIESTEGGRIKDGEVRSMEDIAAFLSFEIKPIDKLKIRPGLRWSYNSTFKGGLVASLNLKYTANDALSFNAAYGQGFRTPSLRELFFEFIDASHNIIGNENLTPEFSDHYNIGATHKWSKKTIGLKSNLTFFYNDITDLISFGFDADDPTFATFINVGRLQTMGGNLNETFTWSNLNIGLGFGVIGRKTLRTVSTIPDNFLFSPEASADINYLENKSKINMSLFYKYNGATQRYTLNDDQEVVIGTIEGFSLLDLTLSKAIVKNTSLILGVKNLFNTTTINNSLAGGGGPHEGGASGINIGYGRSYFFKLAYTINSTK